MSESLQSRGGYRVAGALVMAVLLFGGERASALDARGCPVEGESSIGPSGRSASCRENAGAFQVPPDVLACKGDCRFGGNVAVVGSRVVVTAARVPRGGRGAVGAAYVFNQGGQLLGTLEDPSPAQDGTFGWALAALDDHRVAVGATGHTMCAGGDRADQACGGSYGDCPGGFCRGAAGAVYVYDLDDPTNPAKIPNPSPGFLDQFGFSVAARGSDTLIVGAPYKDLGSAKNVGAAWAIQFDGQRWNPQALENPDPHAFQFFGWSAAALDGDVVVGAPDTGLAIGPDCVGDPQQECPSQASRAGTVFRYRLDGGLGWVAAARSSYRSPEPQIGDGFGVSITSNSSGQLVVGAPGATPRVSRPAEGRVWVIDPSTGTQVYRLEKPELPCPGPDCSGEGLGWRVASAGDLLVASALGDFRFGPQKGAAYVFDGQTIVRILYGSVGKRFGDAIARAGSQILIGASAQPDWNVFVFESPRCGDMIPDGNEQCDPQEPSECCDPARCTYNRLDGKYPGSVCGNPNGSDCDEPDTCDVNGVCRPNPKPAGLSCEPDADQCTADICNGGGACVHAPNTGLACDNDNPCLGDTCNAGVCNDVPVCASALVATSVKAIPGAVRVECNRDGSAQIGDRCEVQAFANDASGLRVPITDKVTVETAATKRGKPKYLLSKNGRKPRRVRRMAFVLRPSKQGRKLIKRQSKGRSFTAELNLVGTKSGETYSRQDFLEWLRTRR